MRHASQKSGAVLLALAFLVQMSAPPASRSQNAPRQQPTRPQRSGFRFRVTTNLVLVNVVARDKQGNLVRGMTKDDFQLFEDGKPQTIADFGFEDTDAIALEAQNSPGVTGVAGGPPAPPPDPQTPDEMRNRRIIILFFDFTAMDPEQIDRSVAAAKRFVEKQMAPADLVALVSLASSLRLDLDLTANRERIQRVLDSYISGQGQGFDAGDTGSSEGAPETGGSFTPDDTDYNVFNTDRKLEALESLMQTLGGIQQKKSIIYFSNGVSRSGIENQAALRGTTAMATQTNCSIYPVDIRGLLALPPGGEAQMPASMAFRPTTGRHRSTSSSPMPHRRRRFPRWQRIRAAKLFSIPMTSGWCSSACKKTPRPTTCWASTARTKCRTGSTAACRCA